MDFFRLPVLVVAFGQPGCGHCEEFLPRFRTVAGRYARCVPAAVFDALWFKYDYLQAIGVTTTPSVVVFRHGRPTTRPIGHVSDAEIEALFQRSAHGLECRL